MKSKVNCMAVCDTRVYVGSSQDGLLYYHFEQKSLKYGSSCGVSGNITSMAVLNMRRGEECEECVGYDKVYVVEEWWVLNVFVCFGGKVKCLHRTRLFEPCMGVKFGSLKYPPKSTFESRSGFGGETGVFCVSIYGSVYAVSELKKDLWQYLSVFQSVLDNYLAKQFAPGCLKSLRGTSRSAKQVFIDGEFLSMFKCMEAQEQQFVCTETQAELARKGLTFEVDVSEVLSLLKDL